MTSTTPETNENKGPTVTLKLNLKERIIAGAVLGSINQANVADWNLIDEWMNVLGLTDETYKEFGIEAKDNGMVVWKEKEKAAEEREYLVSPTAYELFKKKLQDQEKQQGISKDQNALGRKLGIFS